jgi:hypothetical protein
MQYDRRILQKGKEFEEEEDTFPARLIVTTIKVTIGIIILGIVYLLWRI